MSKTACRNSLFNDVFSTHCGKTMKKTILPFIQIQIMLISKTLLKEYIYKKASDFYTMAGKASYSYYG